LPLKLAHTKTLIFDEELVVEGSLNISTAGADHSIAHRLPFDLEKHVGKEYLGLG
jgi:hypothetical protein